MKANLFNSGFELFENALDKNYFVDSPLTYINALMTLSKPENIFMTEFGPKQIQHLEELPEFKKFADDLKMAIGIGSNGKVLNMQVFVKYPGYKITAPHQDGAYLEAPDKKIITLWVPIQDVNSNNSCMFYVNRSHKKGLIPHKNIGTQVRTRTGKTGFSLSCDKYKLEKFTEVPMKVGDILVHDQFCVHYSSLNNTDKPRIALTCIIEI